MDEVTRQAQQIFEEFLRAHPAPPAPDEPAPASPPPKVRTLEEAEDDEPIDETSPVLVCWLPSEGRFVPWAEWRVKTPFTSDPPIDDGIPQQGRRLRARFRQATIELRYDGQRWERWEWHPARSRWCRQKETSTPWRGHACRWAEAVYGPSLEPWRAVSPDPQLTAETSR